MVRCLILPRDPDNICPSLFSSSVALARLCRPGGRRVLSGLGELAHRARGAQVSALALGVDLGVEMVSGSFQDEIGQEPVRTGEVTRLLVAWGEGQQEAVDRLMPLVYHELRRLAARHMRSERAAHTLQPTALVNEAYFRLVRQERVAWRNRAQFFAIASRQMRRVLLDHARRRQVAKRQGGAVTVMLDDDELAAPERGADLLALDEALERLATLDSRKARVVELRIFGGLTIEETAAVLELSNTSIINDFRTARAWLYNELSPGRDAQVSKK